MRPYSNGDKSGEIGKNKELKMDNFEYLIFQTVSGKLTQSQYFELGN